MSEQTINLTLENGKKREFSIQHATKIVIPDTIDGLAVVALPENAFLRNEQIESVTLPKAVTEIGIRAFDGCLHLSEIKSPGLKKIGAYAFRDCVNLISIHLSSGLTVFGPGAFESSGLNEVKIPSKIKVISDSAFENCSRLQTIEFPRGVKIIRTAAFKGCRSLRQAFLPPKIQRLYPKAFYGSGLETLIIPNTVHFLDASVWGDCRSLRVLQLPEGMAHLNKDPKLTGFRAIRIPDHSDDLRTYDFGYNPFLKHVELPKKVKAVSLGSFRRQGLEKFVFGAKITHFDKIVLSTLFLKDFVVYEDIPGLIRNREPKGMIVSARIGDLKDLILANRHVDLQLLSAYPSIQNLVIRYFDVLIKLAEASNALQSKIILIDIASQKSGQQFEL